MYGKYFTYDNEASTDYGLMIAGMDVDSEIPFAMSREILKGTLNRYRNRVNHMGTQWSEVLTFNIEFMRDVCNNKEMTFTEDEVDAINAWLTSPDYPILFHMYDFDFERDSSENSVLIDNAEGSTSFTIKIGTSKYLPVTYAVEDGDFTEFSVTYIPDEELETPPIPTMMTVAFYNGYMSLSSEDADFIEDIVSVEMDGEIYSSVRVRDWLSTYGAGGSYEKSYTKLIRKSLDLNEKYNYFGLFSDVQAQVLDGEVVGFTATFTTDSPFAWTDTITQMFNMSDGDTVTFNVKSSEKYREIYPVIKIQPPYVGGTRSDVTLKNNVDGYELEMSLMQQDTTTIDCAHSKISNRSGVVSFEDLGITDTDYIYWPRLYNGENSFTVTGSDCTLTFEYREPRKVGAY